MKREDTETPKAITADLEELRSMCYFALCLISLSFQERYTLPLIPGQH